MSPSFVPQKVRTAAMLVMLLALGTGTKQPPRLTTVTSRTHGNFTEVGRLVHNISN